MKGDREAFSMKSEVEERNEGNKERREGDGREGGRKWN